ncbi:Uncharacterised protein [uncultured archaeon]|nr:Uncharacterised protein [uncultured archaeon]
MKNFINSDSAVSESISFVLTLGIVIISSALVYFAGAPMLDKSEKNTHFQEMENSFSFLAENIDKVGSDRAPIRTTELKIKGGSMTIAHDSTITVGDFTYELGSVEYIYEGKTIAYEDGGIWTKYPDGAVVMVSRPSFSTGNVTTIPALELVGDYWVSGEGIVRINAKTLSSSLYSIDADNGSVSVVINSSYYKGWAEYLNDIGAKNVTTDDASTTVSSNFTTDVVNVDNNQIITQILEG